MARSIEGHVTGVYGLVFSDSEQGRYGQWRLSGGFFFHILAVVKLLDIRLNAFLEMSAE